MTRCGFTALVGAPNAGKSTLLNRMTGAKLSIVSPKAQTTRFRVLGILMRGETQMLLVDTPGIFAPKRKLDRAMVNAAWTGAEEADVTLLLMDAKAGARDGVRSIAERLAQRGGRTWLVLNKTDLVPPANLLPLIAAMNDLATFEETFMVSATTGDGIDTLLDRLAAAMPPGPYLYPPDDLTDLPDRLLAAEIVREQIFLQTHEEVPYAATVETESFAERPDGSVRIDATIYVTRPGHKAILIGSAGARIREIGARARHQLGGLLGASGPPIPQREGTRRLGRGRRPPPRDRIRGPRLAMLTSPPAITRDRIATVERLIRPYIRHTPILEADAADFGLPPAPLVFKLESLQHSGSFKARGAFANLLLRDVPQAGVAAASGGNHGAAVAYAAARLDIPATIFVPSITSPAKAERIRSYGATLLTTGERYADALAASETHAATTGTMPIHAFDQPETLLGQGTVGLELEADAPNIDTLLVAVGGGGLIGGIAAWFAGRIKLIAVESDGAPTLHAAFAAGRPVDAPAGGIAADSLAPRQIGQLAYPLAQSHVAPHVVLVTDGEIRAAQAALWATLRIVAEPGGAAAFAALLSGRYQPIPGERVAILLCGANTTAVRFDA